MLIRALASLLLCLAALATQAAEVSTPDSIVTFVAPDDFTAFSTNEIKQKWPSASPPTFAVGNKSRTTSIAYDLKSNALRSEDLGQALKAFEGIFTRIVPGISWKRKEIVELSGRSWVMLELTSNAVDADIYNIMLITSFRGRMLTLNFNSTKSDFVEMEPVLRRSVQSIKLSET